MDPRRLSRPPERGEDSGNEELHDMLSALTIHPEPGILKVEETVQCYNRALKTCEKCKSGDIEDVPVDGDMQIKRCLDCDHHFGIDDLTSVYDVRETIKSWKAQICGCGNSDLEKYLVTRDSHGFCFLHCQKCEAMIPVPQNHPEEVLESESVDETGEKEGVREEITLQCECGNDTEELFGIYFDPEYRDRVTGIKCHRCQRERLRETKDDYTDEWQKLAEYDDHITCPAGRTEISNAWGVHEGDHLAWWRPEGYWHHALVESVYPETNEVNVLHYNGPSPTGQWIKGKVVEEKIKLDKENGLLYRIDYDGECYPATIAVSRGRRRLNEVKYSLITNNCEHFVRWCKTGFDKSVQVDSVFNTLKRIGTNLTSCLPSEAFKGLKIIFSKIGGLVVPGVVNEARQMIGESAALVTGQQVCKYLGMGAIVAIEAVSVGHDIYQASKLRKDDKISRDEFVNVVVRRTAQGVAGAAGAAIGAHVGQVVIPVPVVGALVGCTLGALLGHGLGHIGGYLFASNRRKEDKDEYISAKSLGNG